MTPLNPQVMWLWSGQQLAKVDTDEVSLLASRVYVLDAARYLGVILDSQCINFLDDELMMMMTMKWQRGSMLWVS